MAPRLKPRVVIDTNVWLSALVFGGKPGLVLDLFVDDRIEVVISEEVLSELRRKISQRFPLFLPQQQLLEASLRQDAELVQLGAQTVKISRDPKDNMFIETALAGQANCIVSGDKDLLSIGNYERLQIVTPADFLRLVSRF